MKRDYNELIEAGNKAQLEKLLANEHKKGFNDIDFKYAFNRLKEEVEELKCSFTYPSNLGDVRKEAADVANFAHMIILKCDKELMK